MEPVIGRLPPQKFDAGGVNVNNGAFAVDIDAVKRLLDQAAIALFTFLEDLLRIPALLISINRC
jgi:hypothetical protein